MKLTIVQVLYRTILNNTITSKKMKMKNIKMKKNILLLILCSATISVFSQNEIQTKKNYYKSGEIKSELSFYKKKKKTIREGKSTWWYKTGELKNTQLFKKGKLNGERISYFQNGTIKRKDLFKKGKLKEGTCFNEKGQKIEYYDFEIQPEFPGGQEAFSNLLIEQLLKGRTQVKGKLVFKFRIEGSGKISKPIIITDTSPSSARELLELFKSMPDWKPASQDGIPVSVTRVVPVRFQ